MSNKKWYQKLLENLASARDAKIGAVGADQVRQLYKEGEDEQAKKLAEEYLKANATGIATGVGGAGTLTSISKIGVVPTIISEAGSAAGGYVGSKGLGTLGSHIDEKYGTNLAPTLTFAGGLIGSFGGGIGGYKAAPVIIKAGDNAITFTTNTINDAIIKNAVKKGKIKFVDIPTVYKGFHQSDVPIYEPNFNLERWDVVNHGADKKGMFFTLDSPAKSGFLSKRKYTSQWDINSGKTLVQNGELKGLLFKKNPIRNRVVKYARDNGADVVLFDGIADNGLQNQRILFATDKAGFNLADHNYYSRLKPISEHDVANIITGNELKSAFAKVSRKFPKELSKYLESSVDENGVVDVTKLKKGNEEVYKLFDQIGMPYRRMEDVTGQRYFADGIVKRDGTLYDHALGTVKSSLASELPHSAGRPVTQKDMSLLALFHDQGKMVPNIMDNVAKHKFPMHGEYGYYMGKLYGLDMRARNAVRNHMLPVADTAHPYTHALQAFDRATGATMTEASDFVKDANKWLSYKNVNYKPAPISTSMEDLQVANAAYNSMASASAIKAMPKGTRDEVVARQIQSLNVKKELADILETIKTTNPEAYNQIVENIDNPFALKNIGKTYGQLEGNVADRLLGLYSGRKAYGSAKSPIINGEFQGHVGDYVSLVRANKKGLIPVTRWVAGSDDGKAMLFADADGGVSISYGLKTKNPTGVKSGSYAGKISTKEGKLPVSRKMKDDVTSSYLDFMQAMHRIKSGTSTDVISDFNKMLQNYTVLENPTLAADTMRGTKYGWYTTPYQKASLKSLSDHMQSKINYAKTSDKFQMTNPITSSLYESNPIVVNGTPVTNKLVRYYVNDDDNIVNLGQMNDYGLLKFQDLTNRKSLLYSLKDQKDKYPHLWDYLNTSGRVSTDGIKKAAAIDNPNSIIRFRVNDFGGRRIGTQYPTELILNGNNVVSEVQLNSPTREFFNTFSKRLPSVPKLNLPGEMVAPWATTNMIINTQDKIKHPDNQK